MNINGQPHDHGTVMRKPLPYGTGMVYNVISANQTELVVCAGFAVTGTEVRTVAVVFDKAGKLEVTAGKPGSTNSH